MAEPVHALAPVSVRRPTARKPRIPHPHLAARKEVETDSHPESDTTLQARATAPQAESWTPAVLPMARPAGRPRGRSSRPATPAERLLRNAVRFGFFVNGAALLIPRLFPTATFQAWRYDGGDFLLAAAVLLSGQVLLLLGRRSARQD